MKRLRVTKTGKILARHPGQNHFNAKESRNKQMTHKGQHSITLTRKSFSRFIVKP